MDAAADRLLTYCRAALYLYLHMLPAALQCHTFEQSGRQVDVRLDPADTLLSGYARTAVAWP